jgi:tape measure domain-containing protein
VAKLDLGTLYFNVDAQLKNVVKSLNDVKKYNSGLKNVESQTKKVVDENKKLSNSLNGVSKSLVKAGAQAFGVYQGLQLVKKAIVNTIKVADEFDLLNDRLKIATKLTGDYVKVQHELLKIGRETGASLKVNVGLFQNFARSAPDLQATNQEMLTLISSVNKIAAVSGASATDLKFALRQFSQAMAAGIVRAEEFNSIVENTPELAAKIASGMGMTVGKLRLAVLEGNVLSRDVFETLLNQTEKINAEFQEMPVRMGRAWGILKNELQITIGRLNDVLGITDKIVKSLDVFSGYLGTKNKISKGSIFPQRLFNLNLEIVFLEDLIAAENKRQRYQFVADRNNKDRYKRLKVLEKEREKLLETLKNKSLKRDKEATDVTLEEAKKAIGEKIRLENDFKNLSLSIDEKRVINKLKTEREILESIKTNNILEKGEKEKLTKEIIEIEKKILEAKRNLISKEVEERKAVNTKLLEIQEDYQKKLAEGNKKIEMKPLLPEGTELGTPTIADNAFQNTVNTMKNIWSEFRSWFIDEDKIALEEQKAKLEEELELYKDNAELKKQIKKELIEVEKKLEKEKFLWFDKLSQDQVKTAKQTSGFIIGSTREVVEETAQYSKTAFELNKAFALADIAVKTSQAIMASLTIPPPVGPALAIAAGAAGAAQAALVTSQSFSGKEGGGMVGANSMYRVNEAGPEMFSIGGKDYLMTGSMGGNITPNDKISTSTGSSRFPKVTVNIVTPEGTEARVEQNQQGDELQINAIIEKLDKATAQGIRSGLSDTSSALSETFGLNRGVSAF